MSKVMFVGGPRHGKVVDANPQDEREVYRVPAASPKDDPVEYLSTKVVLTFPNPLTGEPTGETWHAWLYVIAGVYPDTQEKGQYLQQALGDAAMRQFMYANGQATRGGVAAVKASSEPVYLAWCEEPGQNCPNINRPNEFVDQRSRADWIRDHKATTGHQAEWSNARVKE